MIITQTPLRLSFLGGNTDFREFYLKHGGCVLTTAIDKYVYCIIKKRFDDKIYINYSKKEIVDHVDAIEHDLVREAMKLVGITKGVEISYMADIPSSGSGLGSSSSFLIGTLNALYQYVGHNPDAQQLAQDCVEIELDILKEPIGVQDQYIAAYGGLSFIKFGKNGKIKVEKLNLDEGQLEDIDNKFMLFYTGITRRSAKILTGVQQSINDKTKVLLQNIELAKKGKKAVLNGEPDKLGALLHNYWELKKSLSGKISNNEIDNMYQRALDAGALGGKISGAGGGGFMLLVVPDSQRQQVREALKDYKEMPFRIEKDGSKVIFNVRR